MQANRHDFSPEFPAQLVAAPPGAPIRSQQALENKWFSPVGSKGFSTAGVAIKAGALPF
jgi:hypothetical protein